MAAVSLRFPLPVRLVERRLTAILFLHGFFAVGAFVAGRSARDALFLARLGPKPLAWMYIASAAAVAIFGLAYTALAADARPDRVALVTSFVFAVLFGTGWLAEGSGHPWVYAALYVHVEVMGAISVMQLWTLANELFNPREARRLYALIGAGGIIANVIVGLATVEVARAFGARAVLLLCAGLMIGCVLSSAWAGTAGKRRLAARPDKRSTLGLARAGRRLLASDHLRMVALLTAVTFLVVTIVDFEFKAAASASLQVDELAVYFGYFYVVVGGLAVLLQLFGTGKLLNRVGVIGSLAILPVGLGASNLLIAAIPKLWASTIAKGADTLFRYSINDATTQILYLPIPAQRRASSKALIDGVVKPCAIALGGLLLLLYRRWWPENALRLALPTVALCAGWLAIVLGLRSKYVQSLQDNLRKRRLNTDFAGYGLADGSTSKVLLEALESSDPRQVLNSLELLPKLQNIRLDDRVELLLDNESPPIRAAALNYFAQRRSVRYANSIFRKLDDGDPAVRAAAISTFCVLGRDKSVGSVKPFLLDADPRIRAAAITGMMRYGGLDGIISAADSLKQLISHPNPVMRKQAARVLRDIGVSNLYHPVLQLMMDPDRSVQREAIAAAGALKSTDLMMPLMHRTHSSETGREAVEALAAYGPAIAPTLSKVLDNRLENPRVRRGVARVLGQLMSPGAIEIMVRHLEDPDEDVRTAIYRSLARTARVHHVAGTDRKWVRQALDHELLTAYRCLADAEALGLRAGQGSEGAAGDTSAAGALLALALVEKVAHVQRRIFLLLGVLFPNAEMERIDADLKDELAIDSRGRRANAVELLDNVLDRELDRKLLPLFEDIPRAEKIASVADLLDLRLADRAETLAALCRSETPWVRACALNYAAQLNSSPAVDAALELTADPSPIVREVALLCVARTHPERARAIAEASLEDEESVVRRRAALIAANRAIG